jgi:TolB-like protein/class 3 adenylate cyclase
MAKDRLSGKLAVILHADVAGSTQLVQQDEQLAHERIQDAFRCFSEGIEKYRGKVLEFRGDALLAEFDRPSDAVTAALAFQADHTFRLTQFTDDLKPYVRVGITMGEVVIADSTITGAGVVLAQRVEQLAEPGGLCITAAIHEALPNRMPFNQEDLGEQTLKGFDEMVRVFRVRLKSGASIPPPESSTESGSLRSKWQLPATAVIIHMVTMTLVFWFKPWKSVDKQLSADGALPLAYKPSIAVLPFDNMSEDPNQEYFSDGIAEDIITDLSQLKNLAVIARNSSFTYRGKSTKVQEIGADLGVKYLLEGSVRKAGNQIRITIQLVDTGNGHHLWAERYDRELTDVFAVQDEITKQIVSALSIQLTGDEQQQLAHNATNSFEAYDLFLQGQGFRSFSKEDLDQAAATFEQVISIDPSFARAYGALAVALNRLVLAGFSDSPVESKERALELARKAVSIYPHSPHAQWALGYVYMYRQQFDKAVDALEHAILLSPSYADGYALLALIKNNLGQAEDAIGLLEKGMKLNPHYSWDYLYNLGRAHYALGHYEQAAEYLSQALERNETPSHPRLFLAASYVQLDRQDDAEWELMQLETSHPEITLSHLQKTLPISDAELRSRLLNDLRSAGISE